MLEPTYRVVLSGLFLATALVGGYYRLRSVRRGAAVTYQDEPLAILVPLRLCGMLGMACLLAYFVRPQWMGWAAMPLPASMRWIGVALLASALPLLAWTFHTLGHNLTATVATRANGHLVVTGPYRFVRHPFYVTVALVIAGGALATALWPVALLGASALALLALRTPLEEAKLIERYGEDYRTYARRTGRFVPRFIAGGGRSRVEET